MLINNAMSGAEIRIQELRQLPKMLVGGLGVSLLIHLLGAIAFNYLPSPIPESAVEVTIIDAKELPPEPSPTVPITTAPKVLSPSVLKTIPVATPIPATSATKPVTPTTNTTVINPAGRASPVKIPAKIAKRSIEQPQKIQRSNPRQRSSKNLAKPSIWQPSTNDNMAAAPLIPATSPTIVPKPTAQPIIPAPEQAVTQKPSQRSSKPIPRPQTIFNDLDNQNVSRSATPQPSNIPSPQISPKQKQIDNLDQFDQDTLGVLSTPTADPPGPVNNRPVAPKSSPGSKIAPAIASSSNPSSSSSFKGRSSNFLGSANNNIGITPGKEQGYGTSAQTDGKVGSGSSIGQGNNSGRGKSIAGGEGTGQSTINGGNGGTAKNVNSSSASVGITLRCAPNADCKPPYPEEANGERGVTVLEIVLADDGSVSNTKISKSSGNNLFDRAALDAAPAMRFVVPSGRQRKFRVAIKFTPDAD
jgi:TonB family protein